MTQREKQLGVAVAAMLGCMLTYGVVDKLALAPARKADTAARGLAEKISTLRTANARLKYYKGRLAELRKRTFGADTFVARAALETRLMAMARQSGLNTSDNWTLRSAVGLPKRGAYREVAWHVTARGKLERVVNFLYLLGADNHLHRISALSLAHDPDGGAVKVRLRYSTIILDLKKPPKADGKATKTTKASQPAGPSLDSPRREQLAMIVARDLFRPYVKRPPPGVAVSPPPSQPETQPRPAPGPPVETFLRVVSLSQLASSPHICISDTRNGQVKFYKVGDRLVGGRIVLVDYREMPRVDNPRILSTSRVIVKIGPSYWAVELGHTLAQKHRLRQKQLPQELRVSPAEAPTAEVVLHRPARG